MHRLKQNFSAHVRSGTNVEGLIRTYDADSDGVLDPTEMRGLLAVRAARSRPSLPRRLPLSFVRLTGRRAGLGDPHRPRQAACGHAVAWADSELVTARLRALVAAEMQRGVGTNMTSNPGLVARAVFAHQAEGHRVFLDARSIGQVLWLPPAELT